MTSAAESLLDGEGTTLGPQDGALLGKLLESLATMGVRVAAQAAGARIGHVRIRNGDNEVDLVVNRDDGRILALEVTLATNITDRDVRRLTWLAHAIGPHLIDAAVLTGSPDAYRRKDGIAVIPLVFLGP